MVKCSCVLCLLSLTAYQCAPEHDGTPCRLGCASTAVPFSKPTDCIRGVRKLFLMDPPWGLRDQAAQGTAERRSRVSLFGL
jgi:hypothetical protein